MRACVCVSCNMSVYMQKKAFLSLLASRDSSTRDTSYALPTEPQVGAERVQRQVRQELARRSASVRQVNSATESKPSLNLRCSTYSQGFPSRVNRAADLPVSHTCPDVGAEIVPQSRVFQSAGETASHSPSTPEPTDENQSKVWQWMRTRPAEGTGGDGDVVPLQQQSFKGPSHRTLARMYRAPATHTQHTLSHGHHVPDGKGSPASAAHMDMTTAIQYVSSDVPDLQQCGAAFIQHQCYLTPQAKVQLHQLRGIPALVSLFSSIYTDVQCCATGATQNAIYENDDNKAALMNEGGVTLLVQALQKPNNDVLHKNITGIFWSLSAKDTGKDKLALEALTPLAHLLLQRLRDTSAPNSSEESIFCNVTGCFRNLSSGSSITRKKMRETAGLVDALVLFLQRSLRANEVNDQIVENCTSVLRNLSYQLYSEIPAATLEKTGPGREKAASCFGLVRQRHRDCKSWTRTPQGQEWLWHPQVLPMYIKLLRSANGVTSESAAGALQMLTSGDTQEAQLLKCEVLGSGQVVSAVVEKLQAAQDQELRTLTGLLRNLTHACTSKDKAVQLTCTVKPLLEKLPSGGTYSETVVNICAALNNLVCSSEMLARQVLRNDGVRKLKAIKTVADDSPGSVRAAKAATTVLHNLLQHRKLQRQCSQFGLTTKDVEA